MRYSRIDGRGWDGGRRFLASAVCIVIGALCGFSQNLHKSGDSWGTFVGTLEEGREITLKARRDDFSPDMAGPMAGFQLDSASKKLSLVWGEQLSSGEWVLTVFSEPGRASGTLRGRSGLQNFQGTWQAAGGGAAVPVQLRRLDVSIAFVTDEVHRASEGFAERALQAAVAGALRPAQYYLRLYHVTNRFVPYTKEWEDLFEAKSTGAEDAFYQKARWNDSSESTVPFAYLRAERGEIAKAKEIYRAHCRNRSYDARHEGFTCLMYASFSEKNGDGAGMREGYDFACDKLAFACGKAFGASEEQLMGYIARHDSAAALKDLQQPGLNLNARHGKALQDAVAGQLKDLVRALLDYGADPNADPSIVDNAVKGRDPEILQLLLAHGAEPPKKDYQAATCPQEPPLEVSPTSEHWLEGALGQKHVRMYLERGGEAVVGAFYDVADWIPLILRGRWMGDGAIEATATTEQDVETGRLKGSVSAAGFTGVWTPKDRPDQAVRLQASRPSCDGKGPWRLFQDARYPITFSYPASWRVNVQNNGVTLTCPDASLMVYDGFNIRITQGTTAAEGPSFFVHCGNKWLYGDNCDCDDRSSCQDAEVVHRGPLTILRAAEFGSRIYCRGGGYIALGSGYFGAVLLGQRWLELIGDGPASELVNRILGTARARP